MNQSLSALRKFLRSQANPDHAKNLAWFFKTGKGEYGEGDKFLGLKVPVARKIAKEFKEISLAETEELLHSKYHEERLTALLILVEKFKKASEKEQAAICKLYLKNTGHINNWDLVDLSCHKIVGPYLWNKDRAPLYKLAKSKSLWERRIAVISTFEFIRQGDFADTLKLADLLLQDKHDLMHKAVGWALREVGNRSLPTETAFLKDRYKTMPRTMLRYAIEKFPEDFRQAYLTGRV